MAHNSQDLINVEEQPRAFASEIQIREYDAPTEIPMEMHNLTPSATNQTRFTGFQTETVAWGETNTIEDVVRTLNMMRSECPDRPFMFRLNLLDDEAVAKARDKGYPERTTQTTSREHLITYSPTSIIEQKSQELHDAISRTQQLEAAWKGAVAERDKVTETSLKKAEDDARDLQRYMQDGRKALNGLTECQASLKESNAKVAELKKENSQLKADVQQGDTSLSELRGQCSELQKQLKMAEESRLAAESESGRLKSELENRRISHAAAIEGLRTEKSSVESRADRLDKELRESRSSHEETQKRLQDAQLEHSKNLGSLKSLTEEASKLKQDRSSINNNVEELQKAVSKKDHTIQMLEKASQEKDTLISQRGRDIENQVQKASTFLRHLSVDVDSGSWKLVAENVLADQARNSHGMARGFSRISSWSLDPSLEEREDSRNPDIKDLFTYLRGFLNAIKSKSLMSAVAQLLVRAFTNAVGDSRLHFMHRVAMCQIVILLVPVIEAQPFMQALDAVDPRITRLVNALMANDPMPLLDNSIFYEDLTVVGLNKNPRGVILTRLAGKDVCWVDQSRILRGFNTMQMLPTVGESFQLALDDRDKLAWFVAHV
ncbi:hypothetical protein FBEOM_3290 [Fusarium beomiforme]|uniref:Uncharacterized protein n=1 Tax=Fusarium beomiforme TaxID=44412 RepID=A0A9P5APX4_9HYPO|nr:hypothetical protein FBEOM_3290 [Fusarium beomiforme]